MNSKTNKSNDAHAIGDVRVRIAPSPTGFLHVGTARAALYNWLHARKHGGQFVLRIEDTDEKRSKGEYEKDIMRHLKWLGLDWDEEYRQSERGNLHKQMVQRLLDEGKAYVSYDESDLGTDRRPSDTRAFREHGHSLFIEGKLGGVVRFKTPEHETVAFDDMVRGQVSFNTDEIEDFSIARAPDKPLYNFVVTVDDADMGITDVIRGEDHISNTPKQILLYRALGFPLPRFAHLPLLLATDKSKLSKRKGTTTVNEFREQGFLPEAMINYLALLGWNPGGDTNEFFTIDELIESFDLGRVRKSGSIFDVAKLNYFNNHYIKRLSGGELLKRLRSFFDSHPVLGDDSIDRDRLVRAVDISKARAETLRTIVDEIVFYFTPNEYDSSLLHWKDASPDRTRESLAYGRSLIAGLDTSATVDELRALFLDEAQKYNSGDRGALLWPMRVALSGLKQSPSPFEIVWVLGVKESVARIDRAISLI